MRKIWKFDLDIIDEQEIDVPATHRILAVQTQDNIPRLWAIVDPEGEKRKIKLYCYGTGHTIDVEKIGHHIGTVQVLEGEYIFHFFLSKDYRFSYI